MTRTARLAWCTASVVLWLVLGFGLTRIVYAHLSVEIPRWLSDAIRTTLTRLDPDYRPDALDIIDSSLLLLILAMHALAALVVAPLAVIAWRHFVRSRSVR
jgi:hypothetical protein